MRSLRLGGYQSRNGKLFGLPHRLRLSSANDIYPRIIHGYRAEDPCSIVPSFDGQCTPPARHTQLNRVTTEPKKHVQGHLTDAQTHYHHANRDTKNTLHSIRTDWNLVSGNGPRESLVSDVPCGIHQHPDAQSASAYTRRNTRARGEDFSARSHGFERTERWGNVQ